MTSSSSESEERCSCRCLHIYDCRSTSYPLVSHGPTLEIFLQATLFLPESFRNYLLLFRVSNLHLLLFSLFVLLRWMILFIIGRGKLLGDAFFKFIFIFLPSLGGVSHLMNVKIKLILERFILIFGVSGYWKTVIVNI